jgi:hypothetical protein
VSNKQDIEMSSSEKSQPRRKLLKAITAGGAVAAVVPGQWAKPALQSAILPAHAQTTVGGGGGAGSGTNDRCIIPEAWAWGPLPSSVTRSFSMSFNGFLDASCGPGQGELQIFNSSGQALSIANPCTVRATGAGGVNGISFSCSQSYDTASALGGTPVPQAGELVTMIVDFNNGCSCVQIINVTQG